MASSSSPLATDSPDTAKSPRRENCSLKTTDVHRDVEQCLYSSLAVFYYTSTTPSNQQKPSQRTSVSPKPRRLHSRVPTHLCRGSDGDISLVATEETGLTYVIEVDHHHGLIRVTFRGSLTSLDWMHDFDFRMVNVINPVWSDPSDEDQNDGHYIRQTKLIGVHGGFRNYLLGGDLTESSEVVRSHASSCFLHNKNNTPAENVSCKYDRIRKQVDEQSKLYPGFSVQVTGHSMGGAMSILTAFLLASDGFRVTCVSLASPRVGNGNFVRAYTQLEFAGRLRSLRVVNSDDVVTALPDTTLTAMGLVGHLNRRNFYLHPGVCLHMNDQAEADLFFPKVRREAHALFDWTHRSKNMAKRALTLYRLAATNVPATHVPQEYQKRLSSDHVQDKLRILTWEHLYRTYLPS